MWSRALDPPPRPVAAEPGSTPPRLRPRLTPLATSRRRPLIPLQQCRHPVRQTSLRDTGLRVALQQTGQRVVGSGLRHNDGMAVIDATLRRVREQAIEQVEFVVRTDEAIYQDRLVKMGWQPPESSGEFVRRLDATGDVEAIFHRFSRHLEAMVRQSARLEPIDWRGALCEFVDRVHDSGLEWWLYGSAALAVRGVAVEPGDVDLHVDDAYLAGELMADLLVEPVTRMGGWVADVGGRAYAGAIIEWLSGAQTSDSDPPHEQDDAARDHLELIVWNQRKIPVPSLDLQLAVAKRRGLDTRAALIRRGIR